MNTNLTEIVFILDRSGSMMGLTDDTIGGFNSFVEKQKNEPGEALLTTVLFDDQYEILHNGMNLKEVQPMTRDQYWARGMTAMYDAIGKTINEVGHRLSETPEQYRPGKVIFVITTDGLENASREFTQAKVKEMIQHQTEKYSWDFIFLGANIDSVQQAKNIGISAEYAANYTATAQGTSSMYCAVDAAVSSHRHTGTISDSWADGLRSDFDTIGAAKSYTDVAIDAIPANWADALSSMEGDVSIATIKTNAVVDNLRMF